MDEPNDSFEDIGPVHLVAAGQGDQVAAAPSAFPKISRVPCICLLLSSSHITDDSVSLNDPELKLYIDALRQEASLPSPIPSAARLKRSRNPSAQSIKCYGLVVALATLERAADWRPPATMSDAEASQVCKLFNTAWKTFSDTRGFLLYHFLSCFPFADPVEVGSIIPHLKTGPLVFHRWVESHLGGRQCGERTLWATYLDLVLRFNLGSSATIKRYVTHASFCDIIAKHLLKFDARPCGTPGCKNHSAVMQTFSLLTENHKHLFQPSKLSMIRFRKRLGHLEPLRITDLGDSLDTRVEVDLQQAELETRRMAPTNPIAACRHQYNFWTKVDYAISACGVKNPSSMGKFAKRILRARYGQSGRVLEAASQEHVSFCFKPLRRRDPTRKY